MIAPSGTRRRIAADPGPVVILGAGAAGDAAMATLRAEGYAGRLLLVDPDPDAPYDRPSLSKRYLAGRLPQPRPLPSAAEGAGRGFERVLDRAEALDAGRREVRLASGRVVGYGALLIATGARPLSLDIPGVALPHVHTLGSLADCRRLVENAGRARRAVVLGAGFTGMEVAASLRTRGLEVTVVAPNDVPFQRALGPDLGVVLWQEHERRGVQFRLGQTIVAIERGRVRLDDETELPAELVVIAVGARPDTRLAQAAGLEVDDGVVVDEFLRTSDVRIHAAGDLARWPDWRTGRRVRVEHWLVARRQGEVAARNMLGGREPYLDATSFWTRQYDVRVSCVGHAPACERVEVSRGPDGEPASFRYVEGDRLLAVATLARDRAHACPVASPRAAPAATPVAPAP